MSLQYWYLLTVVILVAAIAMASAEGGATFFAPLFIFALGIAPEVTVGAALIGEVLGFAGGPYAYDRAVIELCPCPGSGGSDRGVHGTGAAGDGGAKR